MKPHISSNPRISGHAPDFKRTVDCIASSYTTQPIFSRKSEERFAGNDHLNRLIDQALELSEEMRSLFLRAVEKRWPLLHRRMQQLMVAEDAEVPPHFLQPDEFSIRVIQTYYRRLQSRKKI